MPVWQGQGYNSGIRDATNLSWKLGMVVHGTASPDVLDSYETERRPHAKAMIDLSVMAGRIFAPTNWLVAWLRDRLAMALNAIPPIKRYFVQMRFKPMPRFDRGILLTRADGRPMGRATGLLFPQPQVLAIDQGPTRLDDVIGLRFAILSWGCDPQLHMSPAIRDYWARLGAAFIAIVPGMQLASFRGRLLPGTSLVGDAQDALHEWFAGQEGDGSVVVLRPDRVVAAITSPQELDEASRRLSGLMGAVETSAEPAAKWPQHA
jgi:3-(3-hydroxy-phenyl)propionate hydroxylase